MKRTIATTPLPLHSLGVFGDILLRCDILPTSTLVELTLALITGGDPIDKIFIHCSRLQSLTILVGDKYVGDVGVALRTHSNTLPLLTAFQLYYPSMGQMMAEALIAFLRNKVFLERLDLGHHWSSCCFDDIEPVLDILPAPPRARGGAQQQQSDLANFDISSSSIPCPTHPSALICTLHMGRLPISGDAHEGGLETTRTLPSSLSRVHVSARASTAVLFSFVGHSSPG